MRILIATPLYPPDIAGHAPYVKELASRIASKHEVTVVTYGELPEKVEAVRIFPVSKKSLAPIRLIHFFWVLWKQAKENDILFVQNGPSVELPSLVCSLLTRTPLCLYIADKGAFTYSNWLYKALLNVCLRMSTLTFVTEHTYPYVQEGKISLKLLPQPFVRPEILPFSPYPSKAFSLYEESWQSHIGGLFSLFSSCKQ